MFRWENSTRSNRILHTPMYLHIIHIEFVIILNKMRIASVILSSLADGLQCYLAPMFMCNQFSLSIVMLHYSSSPSP